MANEPENNDAAEQPAENQKEVPEASKVDLSKEASKVDLNKNDTSEDGLAGDFDAAAFLEDGGYAEQIEKDQQEAVAELRENMDLTELGKEEENSFDADAFFEAGGYGQEFSLEAFLAQLNAMDPEKASQYLAVEMERQKNNPEVFAKLKSRFDELNNTVITPVYSSAASGAGPSNPDPSSNKITREFLETIATKYGALEVGTGNHLVYDKRLGHGMTFPSTGGKTLYCTEDGKITLSSGSWIAKGAHTDESQIRATLDIMRKKGAKAIDINRVVGVRNEDLVQYYAFSLSEPIRPFIEDVEKFNNFEKNGGVLTPEQVKAKMEAEEKLAAQLVKGDRKRIGIKYRGVDYCPAYNTKLDLSLAEKLKAGTEVAVYKRRCCAGDYVKGEISSTIDSAYSCLSAETRIKWRLDEGRKEQLLDEAMSGVRDTSRIGSYVSRNRGYSLLKKGAGLGGTVVGAGVTGANKIREVAQRFRNKPPVRVPKFK